MKTKKRPQARKRDQEYELVHALRNSPVRLDAGETAFITRELLTIKSKVLQVEYPELLSTSFIPMATDLDEDAEAIAAQLEDVTGKAKIVSDDAKDLPRVNSIIGETYSPVKTIAAEQSYSWLALKRSARQRAPLTVRLAKRARQTIAEGVDYSLAFGDSQTGIGGFTNNSLVTITAATGSWSGLTAQQIYADMINACNRVLVGTKGKRRATNLLLPISSWAIAQMTPWSSTGNSDLTVLKVFQANNPSITVEGWYLLETAGAGGVKRMIAYQKDPDVAEGQLPLPYYEFAPQTDRLAIVIPCVARIGGTLVRIPPGMQYVDGL